MGDRIADLIEYRTKISKDLFDDNIQAAIEETKRKRTDFKCTGIERFIRKSKFTRNG